MELMTITKDVECPKCHETVHFTGRQEGDREEWDSAVEKCGNCGTWVHLPI